VKLAAALEGQNPAKQQNGQINAQEVFLWKFAILP